MHPVFDKLAGRSDDWIRTLLRLPVGGTSAADVSRLDLRFERGHWGDELPLAPPTSLLLWLVQNLRPPIGKTEIDERRARLLAKDETTIAEATKLLQTEPANRAWYVFEGRTYPDVVLFTRDAMIVIEGKRTESGPTTTTTWMEGRHQMWRHVDGAWEVRGGRQVFGLFIVQADDDVGEVPSKWLMAAQQTLNPSALKTSFPHRTPAEVERLSQCFLGVTTWQTVCQTFEIDVGSLPDQI